jgi:hypothetical protein
VDVYIDGTTATGTFLNEITANAPSPDVTAAYPAYTGNHRFIYTIPSKYQDGKQHTLYMYAIDPAGGTYPLLSGSPIAFTMIGTPGVIITSVPKIGEIGVASGTVSGILSSNYSKYAVALYINVSATAGSWWIKPTFATPLTIIQPDGTWSASVTTGGDDVNASEIRAYLVPSDFSVPLCGGDATIPSSLDPFPYYRVTRATIKTFTISPSTVNLTVGGATKQLTATVIDQNNNPVTAPIRWYSSDYSIATVDYYSGIVTPVAAGQTSIYGLIGLKMSNYSAITVSP